MSRIVDLTIPLRDGMDAFPGEPTARFTPFSTLDDGGIEMWDVSIFSQLGTHVDAPRHFLKGGDTVEQIDLATCVGPAVVVDAEGPAIDRHHLIPHEHAVRASTRVLIRTGWSRNYGKPAFWTGFPELTLPAIDLLIAWGTRFVGLDTPTPSATALHETHHRLLGAGIVLVECLTNLDRLSTSTYLVCLPLPLVGLDGAPVRAIAIDSPPEAENKA
jgi:arylformamidase